MAYIANVIPGHVVQEGVPQTADMLSRLGRPAVVLEGLVGTADIQDASITYPKLNPNLILGGAVATTVTFGDWLMFGSSHEGGNRIMQIGNFLHALLGDPSQVFSNIFLDTVTYYDLGSGAPRRMTIAQFHEQLIVQTEELPEPGVNDVLPICRLSETDGQQIRKVRASKVLPVIHEGFDVNPVMGIIVSNRGLVTGVSSDVTAIRKTELVNLPVAAGEAAATFMAHAFGRKPDLVQVRLVCQDADAGWSVGDEISLESVLWDQGGGTDFNRPYTIKVETDKIKIVQPVGTSGVATINKATGAEATFVPTKWKAYVIGWK